MDMPTPCPSCGEVVEFNDMVNHPNEFKTMVCEDCHDRIEDENNRGEHIDTFNNKLEWVANPNDGLIDFKVNGEDFDTWSYEDEPEFCFASFLSIWDKAQDIAKYRDDQPSSILHGDDISIDSFSHAMKQKMAHARAKGRGGWDDPKQCSGEHLATLLVEHLIKGNDGTFEDIANFAMMLHQRNESPRLLNDAMADLKASSGNEIEALRDAIQACENQGLRVMHGNTQITGAILSDSVIELVNE